MVSVWHGATSILVLILGSALVRETSVGHPKVPGSLKDLMGDLAQAPRLRSLG